MAQIVEETITIKISQLAKDGMGAESLVTNETRATLLSVAQELVGDAALVEIATVED